MLAGVNAQRPRTVQDLLGPDSIARLERLDIISRKVFSGKLPGERRSKRRGRSVEFDDYRDYAPGDDLRHLDWNVFARLDRFFVKLFREEEDLALNIVIDASASMHAGNPLKILCAQRLALALGHIGLVNQNRVSVACFGAHGGGSGPGKIKQLAPVRGRRNLERLARFILDEVHPSSGDSSAARDGGDFTAAMRTLSAGLSRSGSRGVVVVLSDFLIQGGYAAGLNFLAAGADGRGGGGFDAYCVHILSPGEIDPAKESRGDNPVIGDLRLTDVETGAAAEVTVSGALLEQYRRTVREYCARLETFCAARGMTYTLVSSDIQVEDFVVDELRRRGLVG